MWEYINVQRSSCTPALAYQRSTEGNEAVDAGQGTADIEARAPAGSRRRFRLDARSERAVSRCFPRHADEERAGHVAGDQQEDMHEPPASEGALAAPTPQRAAWSAAERAGAESVSLKQRGLDWQGSASQVIGVLLFDSTGGPALADDESRSYPGTCGTNQIVPLETSSSMQ